ncbi:hypothetical protein L6452_02675 [Arctium lappa]|uniref:Uncharacterized protein n=1 Tax=Arctium lappa TaxID=4217 RepID=A0ACB9FK42_ARCLA|nr:hypothetical protein L6452_02675 [Arctium lappa]
MEKQFLDFIDRHELGDLIRISLSGREYDNPRKVFTVIKKKGEREKQELPLPLDMYLDEQRKRHQADCLARSFILQGISKEISKKISIKLECKKATGKQLWEQIEKEETTLICLMGRMEDEPENEA